MIAASLRRNAVSFGSVVLVEYFESHGAEDGPWKRIVIESEDGDAQVYLFSSRDASIFEKDYWFETVDIAKNRCLDAWHVPIESWKVLASKPEFLL